MPTVTATALPPAPANVQSAQGVLGQMPYYNLIIQLTQNSLADAQSDNVLSDSQLSTNVQTAVATYKHLPPQSQQSIIQQYSALWLFLPTYITNARIVDDYNQQNLVPLYGAMPNNTEMGQAAQRYLQQFFSGVGVTPPDAQQTTSTESHVPVLVIAGAGLLLIFLVTR